MENNVIKVGNEDNSKTFRITAVWWDNSFEFTLFHEANAWHANVRHKSVFVRHPYKCTLQGISKDFGRLGFDSR